MNDNGWSNVLSLYISQKKENFNWIFLKLKKLKFYDGIDRASTIIKSGGLVALPTETVYGLGADATNAKAVELIFKVKGRPAINPLIIHIDKMNIFDVIFKIWNTLFNKII